MSDLAEMNRAALRREAARRLRIAEAALVKIQAHPAAAKTIAIRALNEMRSSK